VLKCDYKENGLDIYLFLADPAMDSRGNVITPPDVRIMLKSE
jgi:hypothetical protein